MKVVEELENHNYGLEELKSKADTLMSTKGRKEKKDWNNQVSEDMRIGEDWASIKRQNVC